MNLMYPHLTFWEKKMRNKVYIAVLFFDIIANLVHQNALFCLNFPPSETQYMLIQNPLFASLEREWLWIGQICSEFVDD